MRIRHLHRTGSTMLGLFAVMLMFASAPASAQKFEEMFGGACPEYGFSGIATSDGGYISVGSATSHNGCDDATRPNVDIYIVKLNANGSLAWSRTIDIARGTDIARDVIESGSPDRPTYLVTGYTNRSGCDNMGGQDIWLLRIDNSGTLQWLNTYGTSEYNELAFRLIQCNRTVGDERGEIAIAGYRSNREGGRLDGLLLRTTPNGGIVYFHHYGGDGDDGFYGLIEAQTGDNAGDLVLAGFSNSWNESGGTEGWAVRVGPRGDFYGRPAGAATYGGRNYCRLTHVAEVTATREDYGRLIFCGDAALGDSRVDPYFLKTTPWPCRPVADIRWGDARDSYEETWSIREIHDPNGTGLNHGNFIIAGTTDIPDVGNTTYPYMMEIDPGLGLVTGVGMKYYGRTQGWGYTAWPVPGTRINSAGFYLTATAYDFVAGHGSLQMYVVKSDNVGVTDCTDQNIDPRRTEPAFEPNCVDVPYERTGELCEHRLEAVRQRWIDVICNDSRDHEGLGKIANIDLSGEGMDLYPNPVIAGSTLKVSATLQDAGAMTVKISDMTGREIHRVTKDQSKGIATMELATDGLPAGTYIVEMTADGRTQQMRVVIAR